MRFVLIIFLCFLSLGANHISWYPTFDLAHKAAIKKKKNLLIFLVEKSSVSSNTVNFGKVLKSPKYR